MIIQNLVFPSNDFNPTLSAFIRVKGDTNYKVGVKELVLQPDAKAEFNTYFNGFSIEKWRKYTDIGDVILHLELKGGFTIITYNEFRAQNKNAKTELNRVDFFSEETMPFEIEIPEFVEKGMFSFTLIAKEENSILHKGYFYTKQAVEEFKPAHFAIDICTFKREKYILKNLDLLAKTVLNEDSLLKDAFEIFISDNGQSLSYEDTTDKIHIFPNKNAGGAGGFGRSMIEILQSPNYDKFTHIIMMDDDIKFSYETLYRTYVMATTLKREHRNAFIGGAMLKINEPQIQSEAMDLWGMTSHHPVKYNYNITDLKYVLKNEIEDKGNYFGWWYCAMPIGVVKANNLPLPIFIKRDDIEYGLRNGRTFINLNGICVLHEAFDLKRQGYLDYYYWRNQCILNAIHYPQYNKEILKNQLLNVMKTCMLRYRYNDANLAFVGVEDFLKGIDWLKSTDPEALNAYIMNYTYSAVNINELSVTFAHGSYEKSLTSEAGIKKRVTPKNGKHLNRKLFFGLFLKAEGTRYVKMNNPAPYMFYRKKTIINYDEITNKAFVTRKSLKQTFNLYRNYKRLCKLIDKKYDQVRTEYRFRHKELTDLAFWKSYLELSAPKFVERKFEAETIIKTEETIQKKNHAKGVIQRDRKHYNKVNFARFVQHVCFFWMPIYRKRITFYLHERKGYTCNLKYITEELIKQYGKKCDIIWITRYPDAFRGLNQRGIKVVRLNSFKHWLYQFTSKVIVVNDCFPEPVILRAGQTTINTWHACMNYKKIGPEYVHFRNDIARKLFFIRNKQPKLYLSGSQFFTDDTSKSFGYDKKIFIPTGMPRNDIFFKDNATLNQSIRKHYYLDNECHLALYAPTFRDGFREDLYGIDFDRLLASLKTRFGGEWKILYRKHYFVNSKDVILDKNIIDVSEYDDMNELLAVSDVLISDYSSCLWDFSLTKRPSFIYAPDINEYKENDRSFSYPLEKWPFSISLDNDELANNILNFNNDEFIQKVTDHLNDGKSFDDGHASERAVKLIAQKMKLDSSKKKA